MKTLLGLLLATVLPGLIQASAAIAISNAPVTITNSGEYYLANDIIVERAGPIAAIDIYASNVVLNLNGHVLRSRGLISVDMRVGIQARHNTVVRNGRVRGWTSNGILMAGELGPNPTPGGGRIQNVVVSECGHGIVAMGATLRHCTVRDSREAGFYVRQSDLNFCVSRRNAFGFYADDTNTFSRCVATGNNEGFRIYEAGNRIERCVARKNGIGIVVEGAGGTVIRESTLSRNDFQEMYLINPTGVLIEDNTFRRHRNRIIPVGGAVLLISGGHGTRVERNRFVRISPDEINDGGEDTVFVDNIFLP